MTRIIRWKVCCINTVEEAALAIRHGASAVGLVSTMPSGPGVIPDDQIAAIARTIPPGVDSFLLTSKQNPEDVIAQHRAMRTTTLQLVDAFPIEGYAQLRSELPGIRIVQVIHVRGKDSVEEARQLAPHVDALLLDSGNPSAATKELGGTGRTHDWKLSRQICRAVKKPVFLAGGLKPENVGQAIAQVGPYGVDVCSGVRTDGKLDPAKLAAFAEAVQSLE